MFYGGNSYYRENTQFFPYHQYVIKETRSLDSLVAEKNYPFPDLIKIDSQGSELDIIRGATKCLQNASVLIIEIQNEGIDYNIGCPKQREIFEYLSSIGFMCFAPKFSTNPADADYAFINKKRKIEQL